MEPKTPQTLIETAPGKWTARLRVKWRPKSKLKSALVVAVVLMAAAGGAWSLVQGDSPRIERPKAAARPLFTTMDLFTVNLQDPYSERIAQIGVTLQYDDPALEVAIKDRLPAVRNAILLLISSKQVDELLTVQGKENLAQEIRLRTAVAIGEGAPAAGGSTVRNPNAENPIRAVLFSHFIVQ